MNWSAMLSPPEWFTFSVATGGPIRYAVWIFRSLMKSSSEHVLMRLSARSCIAASVAWKCSSHDRFRSAFLRPAPGARFFLPALLPFWNLIG